MFRQRVHLCLFCETKESSEELFFPQSWTIRPFEKCPKRNPAEPKPNYDSWWSEEKALKYV